MDSGFQEILTPNPLSLRSKEKLVLFRLPRDFSIKSLVDQKIDMRHSSKIQTDSGMMFDVKVEDTGVYNIIRPIVTDELKGGQSIGPEFSKVITVAASYQENSNEESTEQYKRIPAYGKVEQVKFLRVRNLQRGSTSTVEEVIQRTGGTIRIDESRDMSPVKHKKARTDEEGHSEKKSKKHDKEHKKSHKKKSKSKDSDK